MKLGNYLVLVVLVLSFSSLVSAELCNRDQSCYTQLGTGYICDEINQSVDGHPQCSLNILTYLCNQSASCTTSYECNGIGSPLYGNRGCGYGGLCVADPSVYGGKCVQDQDCISDTQESTNSVCVVGTCTYTPTGAIVKCDDSSDCEGNQYCYGTYGVCVNKRSEGGFCVNDVYCSDGLYCGDTNTCVGCEDIVDDPICTSQGAYCELNHTATCQLGSHDYDGVAPICVSLKGEGESCWDDACCVTSNCVNGICALADNGVALDSFEALFCNNLTYSLEDHFVDGDSIIGYTENDPVNYSNLNIVLGYTDLKAISSPLPYDASNFEFWYREVDTGIPYMFVYLYSNSTGDICYLHQKGDQVYHHCFESCISPGLSTNLTADNSIHLDDNVNNYPYFLCSTDDMVITSTRRVENFAYSIFAFTDFTANHLTVDSTFRTGNADYIYARGYQPSIGTWANYLISFPLTLRNYWLNGGGGDTGQTEFSPSTAITKLEGFLNDNTPPMYTWYTDTIESYISPADYIDVFCCSDDTNCVSAFGDGFCCDTTASSCYFCGLGSATEITISALTNIIAPDESLTLYSTLTDTAGNPIYNEEIEWTLLSGLGSINAQCTTNYEGICQVIYSAPSEDTNVSVQAEFTGSSAYSGTKTAYSITVSDLSNSLFILVIDSASQQPLGNTKITDVNGVLDPAIKYTMPFAGLAGWTGLNNTVEYYVVQVEREGYTPVLATVFPAPAPNIIPLTKTPESGATSEPLPNWGFNTTVPENVGDVTAGFSELLRNFFAVPFLWVLMIILFFLGLAIVKGVIDYVTT